MKISITGAELIKEDSHYSVVYKDQVIYEADKQFYALIVALSRDNCEQRLQMINDEKNINTQ